MADPTNPSESSLPTTAGAFDKLPDDSGPSLSLDEGAASATPGAVVEGAPSHLQEGVTVSGELDADAPERRDPYDPGETESDRTLKAAGAQLMPR